jgi:hypothetical protein
MRGIIGLILAGLGAFLILVAVLLPTWVVGRIMKFPLNEYQTATLQAANASYFSAKTLSAQTGVTMQATYTIKGDASAGNSSTAVWNEFSWVEDITHHQPVQSQTRKLAFDRRTAELVNCCGASVNGNTAVHQSGVAGYVFPFNTQKKTYQVFDTTLGKPMPFVYSGTANVSGIQTYMFDEDYGPTQTGTSPFLGNLVGSSSALVVLPEYNALHLVYYVDPETGALVNVNEHQTTTLRNPANGASVTVFDADLIVTPSSLATIVGLDNKGRNEIALLGTTLPIVLGIAGGVLLIAGIFLGRKRRDEVATADAGTTAMESPEMAEREAAVTEPPRGRHAAENTAVLPSLNGEAQVPAGDAPDPQAPDAAG